MCSLAIVTQQMRLRGRPRVRGCVHEFVSVCKMMRQWKETEEVFIPLPLPLLPYLYLYLYYHPSTSTPTTTPLPLPLAPYLYLYLYYPYMYLYLCTLMAMMRQCE